MAPAFRGMCPHCRTKTRLPDCEHCGKPVADIEMDPPVAVRAKKRKRVRKPISKTRRSRAAMTARWRRYEREGYPSSRDPIGYRMEDFVPLVKNFVDKYNKTHQHVQGTKSGWGNTPGVEWLAAESGVNTRYIRYLLNYHQAFVSLSNGDKLLTAMDMTQEGQRLTLIPNPNWSEAKYREWQNFATKLSLTSDPFWID